MFITRRTLPTFAAAALLVVLLVPAQSEPRPVAFDVTPGDVVPLNDCEHEDGPGPCFWDATTAGNGVGHSFWIDCQQSFHYFDPDVDAKLGGPGGAYDSTC